MTTLSEIEHHNIVYLSIYLCDKHKKRIKFVA